MARQTIVLLFYVLIGFISLVLIVGSQNPAHYVNTTSSHFDDNINIVWAIVSDIENYPNSKPGLRVLEILETEHKNITKFRENYKWGRTVDYQIIEKKKPNTFVIKRDDKLLNTDGTWTYSIREEGGSVIVSITEDSWSPNVFIRGVQTILGRDGFSKNEFQRIRTGVFQDLIYN